MVTQSAAIQLVKKYVYLCAQKNIRFRKVILFGSVVKGTNTDESDIDVLLVSDQFSHNSINNWRMLAPVTAQLIDIEPHPYPTDLYNRKDPFVLEVERTGVIVEA